jgi:protein-disulfide isomerase
VTLVRIRRVIVAALTVALLGPAVVAAQSADDLKALRQEIESLKAGIGAMQRDLQEIKTLLQGARQAAGPPPPVAPESLDLSVADAYAKGGAGARLVLVEFSDFQCPFCGRHVKLTMPQIEREYVDTGKLRYVVRNMPLEQIHPDALRAAEAAECAGDQGKYWQMHEQLFGHQQALAAPDLVRYAQDAGAEPAAFQKCLEASPHQAKIRQDLADAQAAGINGTPTFFLGFADGNGKVKAARRISGAQPYPVFKSAIEALLAEGAKNAEGPKK